MSFRQSGISEERIEMFERLSAERKELQERVWLPSWYITQGWQLFKENYQYKDEPALLGRHRTVARTLAQYMVGEEEKWERSKEHTSELQSRFDLVCRLLPQNKNK